MTAHDNLIKANAHSSKNRLWVLAAIIVVAVGCLAAVRTLGGGHGETIRLVPYPLAKGQAWTWTSRCALMPEEQGQCRSSNPNIGLVQLSGDEWNLGATSAPPGSVKISFTPRGTLSVHGDLPSAPPCTAASCLAPQANTWVRGYPDILYGLNPCYGSSSAPTSSRLRLPMQVARVPKDLTGTTVYTSHADRVTYDIAYDMWLNPSATVTPCRGPGTLEVMVWTDYNQKAVLPPSMQVTTATIPYVVDGLQHSGANAWSVYADNVYANGRTVPWGGSLWFVLGNSDIASHGTVSVNLESVLSSVGDLLQRDYGWRDFAQHYWLDTIPFGMEFGPEAGTIYAAGPSYFSFDLAAYCLKVKVPLSGSGC